MQYVHLGIFVRIKHGKQWSPWSGDGMTHVHYVLVYLVSILVGIPLHPLWWLLAIWSVEIWSCGRNQWCAITVAFCDFDSIYFEAWGRFGQTVVDQPHHHSSNGGVHLEGVILLSAVFVSWAPLQMLLFSISSSYNLQNLLSPDRDRQTEIDFIIVIGGQVWPLEPKTNHFYMS